MCGFSTSRQFLAGSCQRHERAFAPLPARKRRSPNAAPAFPYVPPPPAVVGTEAHGSAAVPARIAAGALFCPAPQGELSRRSAREKSVGQEELRRFTGEQRSPSGGSIHSPGPHVRGFVLVSAPPKSGEPTRPLRMVLFSFWSFYSQYVLGQVCAWNETAQFQCIFSTRITGSVSAPTASTPRPPALRKGSWLCVASYLIETKSHKSSEVLQVHPQALSKRVPV